MATWGVHSFENDDARAWCQAYREMGLFVAKSTIEVALGDFKNSGLQADVAARAVAAVEAIAFALGRGSDDAVQAFSGAPAADPAEAEALIPLAEEALKAVAGGSGLNAYWKETSGGDHGQWLGAIADLQARVIGSEAPRAEEAPVQAARPDRTPRPPSDDPMKDIQQALAQLSAELQAVRAEMREGLVELARQIGGRGQ